MDNEQKLLEQDEWLVKNSLSLIEKLLIETGLA